MKVLMNGDIKAVKGGILIPKGYQAEGIHAGLRYARNDLAILYSTVPANAAAVYTLNTYQAAPILVTKESLKIDGKLQAVVVNSACANACTGERGLKDAYCMRSHVADKLHIPPSYVAVASTGVIGEFLEIDKICTGIENIHLTDQEAGAEHFEEAILTTDTKTKSCAFQTIIDGVVVSMGGAAKGSGMIHPNMATMLGFITTDANVEQSSLQRALRTVTNVSFNQITVDGDTSTNDMVVVMANGMAENQMLSEKHPEWNRFVYLLKEVSESLAKQIARDGEGATKLVEVVVKGAETDQEAQALAKTVIGSNLVKTAVYGADANWGRIVGAMGRSNIPFNQDRVSIFFGPVEVLHFGAPIIFDEEKARDYLLGNEVQIRIELTDGLGTGTAWGCDLTYDYVKINASYRT
ncbi:bifunctional ornithine acetyltransferase/N-acetylglutamate synthase [Pradoshia sp. D12]|uniref:bifunctional ornithine acetyltransferase/N-acetylglutamate synthase n=1 Tax=Bacillaceae TaxID=186817 RepID=UPI00112EF00E|nr:MULTISPECIES: bifunctional ornithine acetyltransferase/N-acetylglutamate synthase [Bacillaceae]QFK70608.1 bifunctional ornithine acetyltransferase/N-acetylglutamate synthase [Pradoshia sp. D12]TPF72403.1 bifunctional ornithine acetyltransferase/N-acetylglutamate synthase [Bacillus sp. D12]